MALRDFRPPLKGEVGAEAGHDESGNAANGPADPDDKMVRRG